MEDSNTISERANSYSELFTSLLNRVGDASAASAILHEVGKDMRLQAMMSERNGSRASSDDSATWKQRRFLLSRGVDVPESMTKQEASQLIDKELGRKPSSDYTGKPASRAA